MTAARRRAAPPIPGPNVPATSSGSEPSEPEARDWLEPDETVLAILTGSGASLFATERRLVIVRSGAGFRPEPVSDPGPTTGSCKSRCLDRRGARRSSMSGRAALRGRPSACSSTRDSCAKRSTSSMRSGNGCRPGFLEWNPGHIPGRQPMAKTTVTVALRSWVPGWTGVARSVIAPRCAP